jgi:hypothetical protein
MSLYGIPSQGDTEVGDHRLRLVPFFLEKRGCHYFPDIGRSVLVYEATLATIPLVFRNSEAYFFIVKHSVPQVYHKQFQWR